MTARAILTATAIAGTLDLAAAFFFAGQGGMSPAGVLRFVASGPFPAAEGGGAGWAAVGVLVHYGIMAAMAAAYLLAARRWPALARRPWLSGPLYGLGLWFLMYWVVRPLRWPALWPPDVTTAYGLANQLFCHLILVGLPIALVARRAFAR